jgi:putative FmdB family regulatory protein
MPTYEYLCSGCGHRFEEFQSMKADPLITCPECQTDNLRRLFGTGAGLIFKGSGFYITDYKNNSGTNGQHKKKSENSKESADSTESSAKTDSAKSSASNQKSDSAS